MQTEGAIECAQSMMYLEAEDKWGVDEKKRVSSGAKADLQIPGRPIARLDREKLFVVGSQGGVGDSLQTFYF